MDNDDNSLAKRLTGAARVLSGAIKPADIAHKLTDVGAATTAVGNVVSGVHHKVTEPAWQRVTRGEPRWAAGVGVMAAALLQFFVPRRFLVAPPWLLPGVILVFFILLLAADPGHTDSRSKAVRSLSLLVIAIITIANISSGLRLISALLGSKDHLTAPHLLLTGGNIWLTNVIAFSLWYWEFDRGGPSARAMAIKPYPDFFFAQMEQPQMAPADWEPRFPDYFYMSFTNATAFSPTDVLPLSRWAKMLMLVQSALSLALVALVIARAVNTLR